MDSPAEKRASRSGRNTRTEAQKHRRRMREQEKRAKLPKKQRPSAYVPTAEEQIARRKLRRQIRRDERLFVIKHFAPQLICPRCNRGPLLRSAQWVLEARTLHGKSLYPVLPGSKVPPNPTTYVRNEDDFTAEAINSQFSGAICRPCWKRSNPSRILPETPADEAKIDARDYEEPHR